MRFLACLCVLAASGPAAARDCSYWSGNGPGVYNLQNGLTDDYAAHVDAAGLGGLRMGFRIDTQTSWDDALLAQYDAYVAQAQAHGYRIMGIVLYESTTLGQTAWNDDPDGDGVNAYLQVFVDTAKLLMQRYGDVIKDWEIWNEPNCWSNSNYANDPQHAGCYYILPRVWSKLMAETFVQGHDIITSKGLHLITGGLFAHDIGGSFSPATDWITQVYQQGPWDWMQQNYGRRYPWDAFGYHIYIDQGGATSSAHLARYLDAIQATKQQFNDNSPLWLTEFGWSSGSVSEAVQASNLDTALTLFESRSDIGRTFFFKVDDYDHWGIFRGDWSSKPSEMVLAAHAQGCTNPPHAPPDGGSTTSADAGVTDQPDAAAPGNPGNPPSGGGGTTTTDGGCAVATGGGAAGSLLLLALLLLVDKRKPRA